MGQIPRLFFAELDAGRDRGLHRRQAVVTDQTAGAGREQQRLPRQVLDDRAGADQLAELLGGSR